MKQKTFQIRVDETDFKKFDEKFVDYVAKRSKVD